MKRLFGNTYEHKEEIKAAGGKWNPKGKYWEVPDEAYDALHAKLVASPRSSPWDRRFTCEDCGDEVYGGTECWETGLIH